ncbi:MAG: SPFH domain-containing protein [Propionibacteriaceae bacterium]|jgi:regulator of protease activity HflC (stomatin/prohibitin superfamily)|nr:SPFH domain-containing protein [Propionibacteriaceae bacterium]
MSTQNIGKPVGHEGARIDIKERAAFSVSGWAALFGSILLLALGIWLAVSSVNGEDVVSLPLLVSALVLILIASLACSAVRIVSPGDTKVLQFFGKYVGTVRKTGLQMTIPLVVPKKVSIKVRNFETNELKVNDANGNPVNIAAIVVWQVADTAKAVFAVEAFDAFVAMQAESALRHVASTHPYDTTNPDEESLRGSTELVAEELAQEVAFRIAIAGLEVVEARISSLAYAQEIAHAMLQRQQAAAVIAAREQIVEGAVSMVEAALRRLEDDDVVTLDEERKATMVSNLLVVLCGSSQAAPVINTGSLYN